MLESVKVSNMPAGVRVRVRVRVGVGVGVGVRVSVKVRSVRLPRRGGVRACWSR